MSSTLSGAAVGGEGVANAGVITTLTNETGGTISGGAASGPTGLGGAGVSNAGTITTLTDSGKISGGAASAARQCDRRRRRSEFRRDRNADERRSAARSRAAWPLPFPVMRSGGAGAANTGTITKLTNSGAIDGGQGSTHAAAHSRAAGGGAGVTNSATIGTLANSGTINGGAATAALGNATGGSGVSNFGTIGSLINSGKILAAAQALTPAMRPTAPDCPTGPEPRSAI